MTPQRLFWIAFGTVSTVLAALLAGQALLFAWVHDEALTQLPPATRAALALFLAVAFLTWLPVLAYALWGLVRHYVVPWYRLGEAIEAARHAAPGTGIRQEDVQDPLGVAEGVNALERRALALSHESGEGTGRGEAPGARERLSAMLDASGACVVACDGEGRIAAYSRGAWERLGADAGLGLGRPIDHLIDPELLVFAFDALGEQAEMGTTAPQTQFRLSPEGGGRWRVRAEPLGDPRARAGLVLVFEAGEEDAPDATAPRRARSGAAADAELASARFVVFDTETTGLQPSRGDEIVSIGAVAVVSERVIAREVFERLVNPGRPMGAPAERIHGIRAEMLTGQPGIEVVLPEFARFSEGAVLVAHNAAFDMRFLRLKEQALGLRFDQPVLDTMLLSAWLHPHQRSHSLNALIARYGVPRHERHTALGDARMTAEVLLKLLPQLAGRGIRTVGGAQAVSRRVPLARLVY